MGTYLDDADLPPEESLNGSDATSADSDDATPYFEYRSVRVFSRIGPTTPLASGQFIFQTSDLPGRDLIQTVDFPFAMPTMEHDQLKLKMMLFHLGLVLLAWPWMYFGHQVLRIRAGHLSHEQQLWWQHFYRQCFAEWASVNSKHAEDVELQLTVSSGHIADGAKAASAYQAEGGQLCVLCPLGGGKDSLVVFEMLKRLGVALAWLYVGDGVGEYSRSSRLQGIVSRSQACCHLVEHDFGDKQVVEALGRKRTCKPTGHPWAAVVAFDAAIVASRLGYLAVAVGNERSADAGNGVFLKCRSCDGFDKSTFTEVNHQFDKSSDFGWRIHHYVRHYLDERVHHFSPLQPLYELQIASLFAKHLSEYHDVFISCNVSNGCRRWCLSCEKCAFVFALMSAFLEKDDVESIFGRDLFADACLLRHFEELLGMHGAKPFECVGEAEEVLVALAMARFRRSGGMREESLPVCLQRLEAKIDTCTPSQVLKYLAGDALAIKTGLGRSELVGHPAGVGIFPSWWRWPDGWLDDLHNHATTMAQLLPDAT